MHFDFSLTGATLWVFIAVLLFFVVLAYYGIHKKISNALIGRSEKIQAELDEAKRLREEAQALLASYQRQQIEAEQQAEQIIEQAKHDAELMATKARTDLKERLERRAAMAEAKIKNAENQAIKDVRRQAADLAMKAAQDIIQTNLSVHEKNTLIEDGISKLGKALN